MEELRRLIEDGRGPIWITGPDGIGKTALATRLARDSALGGRSARVWIDLQESRDLPLTTMEAQAAIIRTLGHVAPATDDAVELGSAWRATLSKHRGVLVLDDVDDPIVAELPTPPAGWTVIATSRRRQLGDGSAELQLGPLSTADAVALVRRLAWLGEEEATRVATVCEGLPLALVMAARILAQDDPEAKALWRLVERAGRRGIDAVAVLRAYGRRTPSASEDPESIADVLLDVGDDCLARGENAAAIVHFEEAATLSRVNGRAEDEAVARGRVGDAWQAQGELEAARAEFERALQLYRRLGERRGESLNLIRLGRLALGAGDADGAIHLFEEAIDSARAAGDADVVANITEQVAQTRLS